ncbi:pullulanase [Vibrio halioticoli NBRC 102217]|uniref:pullulanase n=1 Tax=Vibrio halioticoli NBRC 102217 TaxID=1219072 RepID=V5F4D6_9VIBR|nr:pullulanase-type alpha-1,6-glucosidase [Vibrio halioticoli]GAD90134.1 pullulanase [Vibrio halioticoli NBRC 102217]
MSFKVNILAKATMPMLVAAVLFGCGGGDSSSIDDPNVPDNTPGNEALYPAQPDEVVIYYKRDGALESEYQGWGLHLWNGEGCTSTDLESMGISSSGTNWAEPYLATGFNRTYGAYYVLKVDTLASDPHKCMNFILHKGDEKGFGSANHKVQLDQLGATRSLFGFHGSSEIYYEPIADRPVAINGQKAHWLDRETIALEVAANVDKVVLYYSPSNEIVLDSDKKDIVGGTQIELPIEGNLNDEQKSRFPHLAGLTATHVNLDDAELGLVLKSQIVLATYNSDEQLISSTEVQKAGVLDDVFVKKDSGNAISEQLGAIVQGTNTEFKLWAPTAKNVVLYLYDSNKVQIQQVQMSENTHNGVWESDSISDVVGKYYRYEITVYHPTTKQIETVMVTDPYSLSLSTNSTYSQVVDLENDASLKPANWDNYERPETPQNSHGEYIDEYHVLYESHLRDFSFSDSQGTPSLNGKYLAITEPQRESVSHLKELQAAGLNTLHILPAFDIATVNEANTIDINDTVADLCAVRESAVVCGVEDPNQTLESVMQGYDPTTDQVQLLMNDLRDLDSFNWGYDPYHYTVPEGSFATNAEGTVRIKEFREMVKATHDMDLKLIMDVVYNHTNASGTNEKSVLDKIVPGYYHRLNVNTGGVENSTCCDNTATENLMMGKLMIDSLVTWSKEYNVDGFRFDLMAHQPKALMIEALEEVRKIRPDTLFYGEGWDFGEVANNARFEQATQINMAGTGIGTFSDRLRDAVRGGSPFDGDGSGLRRNQGFANAAYPNERREMTETESQDLLHNQDLVRLGMAGNLADFVLVDYEGTTQQGKHIDYNGAPAGYTKDPSENISYVSKHDNQTFWDNNAYKSATGVNSDERARMQSLGLSVVMMGQGIPFIHMGSELLRSKSMQRDSYDSGDWFNRVKFDGSDNNWNVGLPRQDKDGANWNLISQIISDSTNKPTEQDIDLAKNQFLELLKIRSSSALFQLSSAQEVMARVDFHNVGEGQTQGLIVMSIDDGVSAGDDLDSNNDAIVVVINASNVVQHFAIEGATDFQLHDVQAISADSIVRTAAFADGTFSVPALTTAVFVQPQNGVQGSGLPVAEKDQDLPPFGASPVYIAGSFAQASWEPATIEVPYFTGGVYSTKLGLSESAEYKFTLGDWDSAIDCDGGNCAVDFTEIGMYEFALDASDTSALKVIEAKLVESYLDKEWYIPGSISGAWDHSAERKMALTDTAGQVLFNTGELESGTSYEFKLTCGDWGQCEHGFNDVIAAEGSLPIHEASGNIAFTPDASASYEVVFDFLAKTVLIRQL